jgi:hypothetical protein
LKLVSEERGGQIGLGLSGLIFTLETTLGKIAGVMRLSIPSYPTKRS